MHIHLPYFTLKARSLRRTKLAGFTRWSGFLGRPIWSRREIEGRILGRPTLLFFWTGSVLSIGVFTTVTVILIIILLLFLLIILQDPIEFGSSFPECSEMFLNYRKWSINPSAWKRKPASSQSNVAIAVCHETEFIAIANRPCWLAAETFELGHQIILLKLANRRDSRQFYGFLIQDFFFCFVSLRFSFPFTFLFLFQLFLRLFFFCLFFVCLLFCF